MMRSIPKLTLCFIAEPAADGTKKRKKRNRWGDAQENKAAGLMGLPTLIMANMTNEQLEAYTLHLRIEEISQKLRINDVVPADGDRYVALKSDVSFSFESPLITCFIDRPHLLRSTTILVDVLTPGKIVTGSVWKTNAIS